MTHPMVCSWQFAWRAEGRSQNTMDVVAPIVQRFSETVDLMTATRIDCETVIADHDSAFVRNYRWRALRAFFAWACGEEEIPSPMAKVKGPKVPLTDVKMWPHRGPLTYEPPAQPL